MHANRLDSRTWLVWGVCAMVPMLISRHPLVVFQMLVTVLAVRMVWADRLAGGWSWIVRVASILVVIGIVFNALTVHAGNHVLLRIPEGLPLVGGPVTLNAVVYGLVSGFAMLTLVLIGTLVASALVWADLVRSLPARIAPLAVAGSVAWSFLPGASRAFSDIRESQASRGHRVRGVRDVPQLVVPLIEGGLERALTMSEALEARGFGTSVEEGPSRTTYRWSLVTIVGGLVVGAYALAMDRLGIAATGFLFSGGALLIAARAGTPQTPRPRYREMRWTPVDRIVAGASVISLVLFLWRQTAAGHTVIFNPYPDLVLPGMDILMILALAVLLLPAVISPAYQVQR